MSNSLDLFLNFSSSSLIFSVYWAACEDKQWETLSSQQQVSEYNWFIYKNNTGLEKLCLLYKFIFWVLSII